MSDVSPRRAEHSRVVSRLPVSPGGRDLFVGREAELSRLVHALDRAIAHDGRLMLLVGEPGIGKTRIARELALRAAALGVAVRWGRCQETEGAPSYWPWVQVLRAHEQGEPNARAGPGGGALRPLLADAVPPPVVASEAESAHARFQLSETVAGALRKLCAESPLLVVLDDLHWADAASLLLLRFVATELADARLLVLGTYRDVEMRQGVGAGMLPELARAGEGGILGGRAGGGGGRERDGAGGAGARPGRRRGRCRATGLGRQSLLRRGARAYARRSAGRVTGRGARPRPHARRGPVPAPVALGARPAGPGRGVGAGAGLRGVAAGGPQRPRARPHAGGARRGRQARAPGRGRGARCVALRARAGSGDRLRRSPGGPARSTAPGRRRAARGPRAGGANAPASRARPPFRVECQPRSWRE